MGMDDHGGDLIEGNAAPDLALGFHFQKAAITGQVLAIPGNIEDLIQGKIRCNGKFAMHRMLGL